MSDKPRVRVCVSPSVRTTRDVDPLKGEDSKRRLSVSASYLISSIVPKRERMRPTAKNPIIKTTT